jgi:hypothetical protein
VAVPDSTSKLAQFSRLVLAQCAADVVPSIQGNRAAGRKHSESSSHRFYTTAYSSSNRMLRAAHSLVRTSFVRAAPSCSQHASSYRQHRLHDGQHRQLSTRAWPPPRILLPWRLGAWSEWAMPVVNEWIGRPQGIRKLPISNAVPAGVPPGSGKLLCCIENKISVSCRLHCRDGSGHATDHSGLPSLLVCREFRCYCVLYHYVRHRYDYSCLDSPDHGAL